MSLKIDNRPVTKVSNDWRHLGYRAFNDRPHRDFILVGTDDPTKIVCLGVEDDAARIIEKPQGFNEHPVPYHPWHSGGWARIEGAAKKAGLVPDGMIWDDGYA